MSSISYLNYVISLNTLYVYLVERMLILSTYIFFFFFGFMHIIILIISMNCYFILVIRLIEEINYVLILLASCLLY